MRYWLGRISPFLSSEILLPPCDMGRLIPQVQRQAPPSPISENVHMQGSAHHAYAASADRMFAMHDTPKIDNNKDTQPRDQPRQPRTSL